MNDRVQSAFQTLQTLRRRRHGVSYAEVFEGPLVASDVLTARSAFARFLASAPLWAKLVLRLPTRARAGVHFESNEAIVFGFDHAHATYRSVLSIRETGEAGRLLRLDTAVLCHDRLGRAGIGVFAFLHRRLVRSALASMVATERATSTPSPF